MKCHLELLEPSAHFCQTLAFPQGSLPGAGSLSRLVPAPRGEPTAWHHRLLAALRPGGSKSESKTSNGKPFQTAPQNFCSDLNLSVWLLKNLQLPYSFFFSPRRISKKTFFKTLQDIIFESISLMEN